MAHFVFVCFMVGSVKASLFIIALLRPFFTIRRNLHRRYRGGRALETGGSEGIGLGIAEELAKEGFDLILGSRSKDKLQKAILLNSRFRSLTPKLKLKSNLWTSKR